MTIREMLNNETELTCISFKEYHTFLNKVWFQDNNKCAIYYWYGDEFHTSNDDVINDGREVIKSITFYTNNIIIVDVA